MRMKLTMSKLGLTLTGLALLAMVFAGCSDVVGGTTSVDNVSIFHNDQPAPARIELRIYPHRTPSSAQLEAHIFPIGANNGVIWNSSHPNVASVNSNGHVTAGDTPGFATITVTSADGSHQDSVTIRVRREELPAEAGPPSAHSDNLLSCILTLVSEAMSGELSWSCTIPLTPLSIWAASPCNGPREPGNEKFTPLEGTLPAMARSLSWVALRCLSTRICRFPIMPQTYSSLLLT